MDAQENSRSSILSSSLDKRIPIYVMMPVDAFCIDGTGCPRIRKIKAFTVALKALKLASVHGIAVEVWWGIVECFSSLAYDWSLYEELFKQISNSVGDHNKHIYYRDQNGFSNDDYLTLGVGHVPLFCSRTAFQCYEDFLSSFAKKFESLIGTVIEEISVGLGPSGGLNICARRAKPAASAKFHISNSKGRFIKARYDDDDDYIEQNEKILTPDKKFSLQILFV
ncbi:hypothetical protein C1H46_028253 [Malus baccata]|uniref:Beta-amylase n=1 Tax=Malus baccata TaxID=106549 RepID=A0A540LI75_MALBA|nr:hypothetical protein C1H46_028253 [Malus baccata]